MTESHACASCGAPMAVRGPRPRTGRPPRYCSNACRQRAFRQRNAAKARARIRLPSDGFVGRLDELDQLTSLARPGRLLTLTGPGGVGKTRLALELVKRLPPGHPPVVIDLTAEALTPPPGPATTFVLDSCEARPESAAQLAENLLKQHPEGRVLATARQPLGAPGELVFRVEPLRRDAVRLFTERARNSTPAFEPDSESLELAAEVCRRADGLPLMIELAARWLRTLTLRQIVAGLDAPLSLFADNSCQGRHSDLQAVADWSYRLLDSETQKTFRALCLLRGSFDEHSAAAVRGADPHTMGRQLSTLEDRSLIRRTDDGRFRHYNTFRAYGLERLNTAKEARTTVERLAGWLAELAEPLIAMLFLGGPSARTVYEERENLLAAVIATAGTGNERHVLLGVTLARIWHHEGRIDPARQLLADLLPRARNSAYRSEALCTAAWLACLQGDDGTSCAEEAVALENQRGRTIRLVRALTTLGIVRLHRGLVDDAVRAHQCAVRQAAELDKALDVALCRQNLAWSLLQTGKVAEASRMLDECLPPLRALSPPRVLGSVLSVEGAVHLAAARPEQAEAAFRESLRIAPTGHHVPYVIDGLGILAVHRDDLARARCLFTAADTVRQRLGVVAEPAWQRQVSDFRDRTDTLLGKEKARQAANAGRRLSVTELIAAPDNAKVHSLTGRELEVTRLVADGLTNREIAERLRMAASTVQTHLAGIRTKLGLRSREQIATWAAADRPLVG